MAHYCLPRIHRGQLVFTSILEKFDIQVSFCIAVYCSNASSSKVMECVLPQYKLDLWSKYGFNLKRLLLPQLPLDCHLNIYMIGLTDGLVSQTKLFHFMSCFIPFHIPCFIVCSMYFSFLWASYVPERSRMRPRTHAFQACYMTKAVSSTTPK